MKTLIDANQKVTDAAQALQRAEDSLSTQVTIQFGVPKQKTELIENVKTFKIGENNSLIVTTQLPDEDKEEVVIEDINPASIQFKERTILFTASPEDDNGEIECRSVILIQE